MEQEISSIISKYQTLNKDIDLDFIIEIIILYSDHYDLNDYILNTTIFNNASMPQAQYNITNKEIYMNPISINKILLELDNEFEVLKHSKSFGYLYVIKILLHEIEHAYQQKKLNEQSDLESEILRAEYSHAYDIMRENILLRIPKMLYLNKLKDKYYNYSPSERLAEHIACEKIEKISFTMQDEKSYDVFQHFKYGNILRGYNVGLINYLSDAPTKTYLEKVNPCYAYSIIENLGQNMSQDERMKFGLEVEKEILNKTAQEWQRVYVKIKNNKNQ